MLIFFVILFTSTKQFSTTPSASLSTQEPNLVAFGDFHPQWAVLNVLTVTSSQELKKILFYKNGFLSGTFTLQANNRKINGHFLNDDYNARYFAFDYTGIFRVYQTENFNLAYTSQSGVSDITFTSKINQIVYIMMSTHKMYKLDCGSYSITDEQSLSNIPVQVVWSAMRLFVYSIDTGKPSQGYIAIYDENFNFIKELVGSSTNAVPNSTLKGTLFSIATNHTLNMQTNGSCLVRSYWKTVQIWNITSGLLIHTKSLSSQVYEAMICGKVLMVLLQGSINFYEYKTWLYYKSENYTFGYSMAYMKCFNDSSIGVYSPNINLTIQYMQFSVNSTAPINSTINSTNNTNSTSGNNNTLSNNSSTTNSTSGMNNNTLSNNTGNTNTSTGLNTTNSSSIENWSISSNNNTNSTVNSTTNSTNNTMNGTKNATSNLSNSISNQSQSYGILFLILNSSMFNQSASIVAQIVSLADVFNARAIFRPLSSLIQQFVFYGYHSKIYTSVVEIFIHQSDILNELRIKLKILNLKILNPYIDSSNQRYLNESSFSSTRAPNSIYFTDFLKEIAVQNFIFVIAIFLTYILLYKLAQYLMKTFPIWKKLYIYFHHKIRWWNFVAMIFSYNIRTFSFYCFAQLSILVSFNFVDKLSLMLTICLLLVIFIYTFSFYLLVFRYSKPQFSKQLLQICKYSLSGFVAEQFLNSIRGFLQSFVQASFTNRHQLQIFGLILTDMLILIVILKMRKKFNHQSMWVLIIGYLAAYLCFDIYIAVYSLDFLPNYNFDSTFTVIFLSLIVLTLLKMLFIFFATVFDCLKAFKKSNKIILMPVSKTKQMKIREKIIVQSINSNENDQIRVSSQFGKNIKSKKLFEEPKLKK